MGADTDGVSLNGSFSGPLLLPPKNQRKLDSLSQLPLLPSRAHQLSWSVGAVRALEELVGSPAKGWGGGVAGGGTEIEHQALGGKRKITSNETYRFPQTTV